MRSDILTPMSCSLDWEGLDVCYDSLPMSIIPTKSLVISSHNVWMSRPTALFRIGEFIVNRALQVEHE